MNATQTLNSFQVELKGYAFTKTMLCRRLNLYLQMHVNILQMQATLYQLIIINVLLVILNIRSEI